MSASLAWWSRCPPRWPGGQGVRLVGLVVKVSASLAWWSRCPPRWPGGQGVRLVGLVVKVSASRATDQGFNYRLLRDFDLGQVIPVTGQMALQWLPCQAPCRYRVSAGTGRPGVCVL